MPSPADRPTRAERFGAALVATGVAAVVAAFAVRAARLGFVCDDAFISFRYARNLLEGHGLVFNPGEWVEGYTNFLWVIEVAALWGVGVEPMVSSVGLAIACTIGTLGLVAWWAGRGPPVGPAWLAPALAVVLLCSQRSFAVWTSGGLETRQFTFLVTAGFVAAATTGARAAAVASTAFALAALTRPEGLGVFALCAPLMLAQRGLDLRRVGATLGPFAALVGGHLAFRYATYGMLVPNTYVAKHVGAWHELGHHYFVLVGIESGLYLLAPLALLGTVPLLRASGRATALAAPLCVLAHAFFVHRLGGDHFEFRPLDWWWPALAVTGAAGALWIGAAVSRVLRLPVGGLVAVAVVGVTTAYGSALEVAHDREVARYAEAGRTPPKQLTLSPEDVPGLPWLPGLASLLDPYNEAVHATEEKLVASRHHVHAAFAANQRAMFAPYGPVRAQLKLPPDAVAGRISVGIMPFYLPDLVVVDERGLTDATVARNPVPASKDRKMAHDRRPPPGYLAERGVNITVRRAAASVPAALAKYPYALPLTDAVVLSFGTTDPDWAERSFAGRGLAWRAIDPRTAANVLVWNGVHRRGHTLWSFERVHTDWRAADDPETWWHRGGRAIRGTVGTRVVSTRHPRRSDKMLIAIDSPPVTIGEGWVLAFLIGGSRSEAAGVALVVDGTEVAAQHPTGGELSYRWLDASAWAGRDVTVRIFDRDRKKHVAVDHVVWLAPRG